MTKEKNPKQIETEVKTAVEEPEKGINGKGTFKVKVSKKKRARVHYLDYPNNGQISTFERVRRLIMERDNRDEYIESDQDEVEANLRFYDMLFVKCEGEGGAVDKAAIKPSEKSSVAKKLWDIVCPELDDLKENDLPVYTEIEESIGVDEYVFPLSCWHENRYVMTYHVVNEPTANQLSRYHKLQAKGKIKRKALKTQTEFPLVMNAKAALYNELFVRSVGYAGEEIEAIPIPHKLEVLANFFNYLETDLIETEKN